MLVCIFRDSNISIVSDTPRHFVFLQGNSFFKGILLNEELRNSSLKHQKHNILFLKFKLQNLKKQVILVWFGWDFLIKYWWNCALILKSVQRMQIPYKDPHLSCFFFISSSSTETMELDSNLLPTNLLRSRKVLPSGSTFYRNTTLKQHKIMLH